MIYGTISNKALGMLARLLLLFVFLVTFDSAHTDVEGNRILYLMRSSQMNSAIELYKQHALSLGYHDRELLQQMGVALLEQGQRSDDVEARVMTLFGAGIAANDKTLYILEEGIRSSNPQIQLISLNDVSRYQNDRVEEAIRAALTSNYLLIRLEAIHQLALRKSRLAVSQSEALMCKVDKELHPIFPQFFAMVGTVEAMKVMNKLLSSPDENVRVATIKSAADFGCDNLISSVRMLATQHGMKQQEACAYALGIFKDQVSVPKLQMLSQSSSSYVKLAALQALYRLGKLEARSEVEQQAKAQDLFAIHMLAEMPGSENALEELLHSSNIHVRVNAAFALLQRRDPRCLPMLGDILVRDPRDLAFSFVSSPGKALKALRVTPSAQHNLEDAPMLKEESLAIREEALRKALELPEKEFLRICASLMYYKQNELIPTLVTLLEQLQTPEAIALLKQGQQQVGAPLIRNYCALSLFRLNISDMYGKQLQEWMKKQINEDLIRFRAVEPFSWFKKDTKSTFQLTPEETSMLLIQGFEAFTQKQEDQGIDVLLEAIQNGNAINRYALAGLLIRAAQ